VNSIDRARLIQERWFSLIRLLLIEAYLFQVVQAAGSLGTDVLSSAPVPIAFAVYTLVIAVLAFVLKSWPSGLAYATAAIDALAAVAVAAGWSDSSLGVSLVPVAAAGIAIGIRRFPVFETFAYSFVIAVGMIAARFLSTQALPTGLDQILPIAVAALIPVLVRITTLAPDTRSDGETAARLASGGQEALAEITKAGPQPESIYFTAAAALARLTGSALAGVVIGREDGSVDLYSAVGSRTMHDKMPAPSEDQLASRLLKVSAAEIFTRSEDLGTRGLPDQYPTRLNNALAAPLPHLSPRGAALFAVNHGSGPYRDEDRILGLMLGREIVVGVQGTTLGSTISEERMAATEALLAAVEAKRPGSRAEAEESARLAMAIARELGWSAADVDEMGLAALLHDVGELAIPDTLLDKTDQLMPDEYERMKTHPRVAAHMIDFFNRSPIVLNAVISHHERWDGRGYPQGLSGANIPLEGRIMSLADAMEAMLSPKSYRPALEPSQALQEVIKGSGTQFDPSVVQVFLAILQREGQAFLERHVPSLEDPQEQAGWYRES
jgi:putative nucleotidyltransferase with HDIG domain